ncbi:serine-type D-Ala-D-Ala carboxypeptidase [Bacteriovorax sp. BSW11_IV]|uniref:M15 family metallopeptidase n=1 Tax=Bacteriovorax sp. BSW11_IV TaxID=1353529 RepID=UPI00038A4680|nr:M15 family metallopeptidase [Bacteriovorax sp. BSW11_IV]EQC48187.1 serine-type D-Ala-D-Ala carboxypeptidase [Bacteriovorax sp. BSW11_IV]
MELSKRLTGQESDHLDIYKDNENIKGLAVALDDFYELQKLAKTEGLELKIISGFRDFERQKMIWNKKAKGEATLYDKNGNALNYSDLSEKEIVFSILRWSAFPGASRHHWGTDFDIIDENALNENPLYKVELLPSEYQEDGIFEKLGKWLEKDMRDLNLFFHPYASDLGGVSPEPWHISHIAASSEFEKEFTLNFFLDFVQNLSDDVALLNIVKEHAEEIYRNYIINTSRP